jgi:hypothetical protein
MNEDISTEDIYKWDNQLFQLASYEVTGGLMILPSSIEEAMELQQSIFKKFNYFKRLIQIGESTLEELHESVLRKNGAIFGVEKQKRKEDDIDELVEKINEKDLIKKEQKIAQFGVNKLIQQLLLDLHSEQIKSGKILPSVESLFSIPSTQKTQENEEQPQVSNIDKSEKNEIAKKVNRKPRKKKT